MGSGKALRIMVLLLLLLGMVPMIHSSNAQTPISQNLPAKPNVPIRSGEAGRASSLGLLQEGEIQFTIGFSIRNSEALNSCIENSNKQIHGVQPVLTEEQFEAKYSPAQTDYDQVISYLLSQNLSITQTWANRLLINGQGSVEDVQKTFGTQIGLFAIANTTFYESTNNILVPHALSSFGIDGIDVNSYPLKPDNIKASGVDPSGLAYDKSPSAFRNAYGTTTAIQAGWTGAGKTIAIVDAYGDPTINSDVSSFNSFFGLPALSLTVAGTNGSNSDWATETAIDVEWAHAMAPGAAITLQLAADSNSNNMFGAVNTLVQQTNPPNIISLSWSGQETSYYSSIFAAAAAKGIKVYASTGDKGAYNDGSTLSVGYPASDPNVIAVGGTTIYSNTVQGTDQFYENGWSGSGGGYSSIFSEPSYQTNAGITDTAGKRAIPDVCLDADPSSGVTIYIGGSRQTGWGGTSLSAPMMAGISAVALNGNWNLDNNAFYSTYGTSLYDTAFHDVYLSGNNGNYSVQTGWDAVTGLGSINLHNFVTFNSQSTDLSLTSQSLSSTSVVHGQTFSLNYGISNPSNYSLIQIGLGASIRLHGATTETKDSANDIYITLPGGSSSQIRQFATSSSLTPGSYDVMWSIWMGPPGMGNLLSSSGWQMNQLQILSSSSEFDFNLASSPSSITIPAGRSANYSITSTLTSGTASTISLSCTNVTAGFSFGFNQPSGNPTFSSTLTVQTSSSTAQGSYALIINGTGGGKNHSITVNLNVGDSYEPDDSFSQYSSMLVTSSLQSQSRSIEPASDNDYIRFYATPGNYTFYTSGSTDTYGYLYNSSQNLVSFDDDSGGNLQFKILYQVSNSDYYFLRISSFLGSTQGPYTLYYSYAPPPSSPSQINPANGVAIASNSTAFSWNNSSGAVSYQVQVTGPTSGTYSTALTSYTVQPMTEGAYTWRVRAYNSSGWSEWTPSWSFTLDTTPPSTPNPDDGTSGWSTINTPAFTWLATDTGSGIAGYYWRVDSGSETWTTTTAVTLAIQTDGSHVFYVKAKDNSGNNGTYGSHAFQIDTTYPSGSLTINQGAQYTTSASVTLTLTYIDSTSGVDKVRYSNDGIWDTELWESALASKAWVLPSGDGTKTVYYQIRDGAGLLSNYSATIILDTTSPTGSITINDGAKYTTSTSVMLTLTYNDGNGISQVRFSNDGVWDNEPWENAAAIKDWILTSGDGTKTVYFQIKDNAGLLSTTFSPTIILDTSAPTGSVLIDLGIPYTNSTTINLALSASDATSGVSQVRFSNDNVTWSSWETYVNSKTWSIPSGDGAKNVYVQYIDNGGLVASYNSSIILDTTPPEANGGQSQTLTQGQSVAFDASASVDDSGITSYVWDFGDGTQGSGVTASHTYSSPGTYTAKLTITDSAGNTATTNVNVLIQAQPTPTPVPASTAQASSPTSKPLANPITPTPTSSTTASPSPTASASPATEPTATTQPTSQMITIISVVVIIGVIFAVIGVALTLNSRRNKK